MKTLQISDFSLTKGFESLFSSMGRTSDFVLLAKLLDKIGYYSVEAATGYIFEVMHRHLNEDPWERIRLLVKSFKRTPVSVSLRGRSLTGFDFCPDDVINAFIERLSANGVGIVRLSDPLNNIENLKYSAGIIASEGLRLQGTVFYSSTSENGFGDERFYTKDYYLNKVKELEDLGAENVCIEDNLGILSPYVCAELISFLKDNSSVPVHLNLCSASGTNLMALLKGVEAGASGVGTCISPLAFRNSFSPVESVTAAFKYTPYETGFDLMELGYVSRYMEDNIVPKYRLYMDEDDIWIIDSSVLTKGMNSKLFFHMKDQLKKAEKNISSEEICKKFADVRHDFGNPPLTDPVDKIIASQAVNNILFDEPDTTYRFITDDAVNFIKGKYGSVPGTISKTVIDEVNSKYPKDSDSCENNVLSLNKAGRNIRGLAADVEDELIYALFPKTGKRFLKWKYLRETPPEKTKPLSLKDANKKLEEIRLLREGKSITEEQSDLPEKGPGTRTFNVFIDDEYFEVAVDPGGEPFVVLSGSASEKNDIEPEVQPKPKSIIEPQKKEVRKADKALVKEKSTGDEKGNYTFIKAPMPGSVVSLRKKSGEHIKKGEVIVILEAMKMENPLRSPVEGCIREIRCSGGDQVPKDFVLCVIESDIE